MSMHINTATTGIRAATARLNVSANNLANANTPGYKTQRLQQADVPNSGGTVSDVFEISTPGALKKTDKPLDLAIAGKGAFAVKTPEGEVKLTRNGSFRQDSEGRLVDNQGNQLIIDKRAERSAIGHGVSNLSIAKNGTITGTSRREEQVVLGQLQAALPVNGDREIHFVTPGTNGTGEILSGFLESSTTDIATEMVAQITAGASVKANANTIKTQDEMLGTVLDLKG